MKKVLIKIKGTQSNGTGSDNIEFSTEGELHQNGNDFSLSYEDGELLGEKGIKTRLITKGENGVILQRTGSLSSKLIIEKGIRNSCFYSVPQGDLTLGIYGKTVQINLKETGGTIKLVYSIDANMQFISENTVEISVKEVKQ